MLSLQGIDAEHVDTLDEVCELLGIRLDGSEITKDGHGERGHCCQRRVPNGSDQVESRSVGIQVDRIQIEDTSVLVYDSEDERQAQQGVAVSIHPSSVMRRGGGGDDPSLELKPKHPSSLHHTTSNLTGMSTRGSLPFGTRASDAEQDAHH